MAQAASMPMCPTAETCKGIMENPLSSLMIVIPEIAFIALGVLIVIWPSVLPWLVARRAHPGEQCHAEDGRFHTRGRHPASTRRWLAAATTLAPSGT